MKRRHALKTQVMSARTARCTLYLALWWFMNVFYFCYHIVSYPEAEIVFNLSRYELSGRHCNLASPPPSQDLSFCLLLPTTEMGKLHILTFLVSTTKFVFGQPFPLRYKLSTLGETLHLLTNEVCVLPLGRFFSLVVENSFGDFFLWL